MSIVKIAVIACSWKNQSSTAQVSASPWSRAVLEEIFQTRNGWSIGSYWDDCSLGFRTPAFEFFDLGTYAGTQETEQRGDLHAHLMQASRAASLPVDSYKHCIFFIYPPPNPAGAPAVDDGAIFDQGGAHNYFAHETGHVLGLDHPFGRLADINQLAPGFSAANSPDGDAEEYGDVFCVMGDTWLYSFNLGVPTSPGPVVSQIPASFWRGAPMPSAALLFHYWPDFRDSNRVVTIAPFTNQAVTLTALSEHALGGPVLLRIPVSPTLDYLIEYRKNSNWDRGLPQPTLVVHSHGVPSNESHTPRHKGLGHLWFEYAIPAPFHDQWTLYMPSTSIEVVGLFSAGNAVTVQVSSPAAAKSADLQEDRGRGVLDAKVADQASISLSRGNDSNLCHADAQIYQCQITEFGQEISLQLVLWGWGNPQVTEWKVATTVIPANVLTSTVTANVLSTRRVILRSLTTQSSTTRLGTGTSQKSVTLVATPSAGGITLRSQAGSGAFSVDVEATIVDAAVSSGVPSAQRTAMATVRFEGDRVDFDEDYMRNTESCWAIRTRVPNRERWKPSRHPLPPWLHGMDRQQIFERFAVASARIDGVKDLIKGGGGKGSGE